MQENLPLAGILTLLDVDEFLRRRKAGIRQALHDVMQYCRKRGMTIGFVTGAPLQQVAGLTPVDVILAESGSVKVCNGEVIVCEESSAATDRFLASVGLPKYIDGLWETVYGSIIVEGRRMASFTALCDGAPPHYPKYRATARCRDIEAWLSCAIRRLGMPLLLSVGNDDDYHWIDVINPNETKSKAVQQLLDEYPHSHIYYGGDAYSDLQVVRESKNVIPLATRNCIAPMREEAQRRGIYVDGDGPNGGVEEVLRLIVQRHLY